MLTNRPSFILAGLLTLAFCVLVNSPACAADTIIVNQPAGKLISMSRETTAMTVVRTPDGNVAEFHHQNHLISELVEGDDGYIYIKNPFTYYHTNSWIKGERQGDQVIVHTPQPVYKQGSSTFYLGKICMRDMEKLTDDQYGDPTAEEGDDIVFTYRDGVLKEVTKKIWSFDGTGNRVQVDGSPMLALVSPNYVTKGYSASFTAYGDYNLTLTPVTDEPNVLPADVQAETYTMVFTQDNTPYQTFVNVAFAGNEVYLNAFRDEMPDAWAKGTIDGNKITFPTGQYLGPYLNAPRSQSAASYAHLYFLTGTYDPAQSATGNSYRLTSNIVFTYNAKDRTFYSENDMFVINVGKVGLNYLLLYDQPSLTPFTEQVAQLRNPEIVKADCERAGAESSWADKSGSFTFRLYDDDSDGNLLQTGRITYTIYDNDTPIVIDGKTDIPFTLDLDGAPLWSGETTQGRLMAYYFHDEALNTHTLSVEQKYVDSQGNEYRSARIGYDYAQKQVVQGIADVQRSMLGVQRVYDLQGRRIATSQHGLNIVRRADGSTVKVVKR